MYNVCIKYLLRNQSMRVRRNISVDKETSKKLVELARKSHRNVSQWITEQVWKRAEEIKFSSKSGKGMVK